ncbi:MAG: FecR family protein [Bacteroidetes bacterium]|nr:FecR family protein [Bacteroidota bacterium]
MPHTKMNNLFQRYYEKTATEDEVRELMEWMADPANEPALVQLMRERWEQLEPGTEWMDAARSEAMLNAILPASETRVIPIKRNIRLWPKVAAAAVVILLLSAGAWLLLRKPATQVAIAPAPVKQDVLPGGDKAVLTLANGSTIVLDSADRGLLAKQGGTNIRKNKEGQLLYETAFESNRAAGLNTISTPRGGQYQVVLPDGTKVWLNAASSLRFPTAFVGDRTVILKGEAYFEVAQNAKWPFHVVTDGPLVHVLGTHFNVMAYEDEDGIKTSLLEGKVSLSFGTAKQPVSPSEQVDFDRKSHAMAIDKTADMDKAVAWKNGLFDFDDEDIQSIMRQIARWYDVKVQYAGAVPVQHFTGYIRRQATLSQVLDMLQLAGGVSFSIEGKTITVKTR